MGIKQVILPGFAALLVPTALYADSTVTSKNYVDSILSALVTNVQTGTTDGTIKITKNGASSDVAVKNVQTTTNLVKNATGLSASSTDTTYPSAKLVYESIKNLDENVIETVKTNGTALTVTNKAVDIPNMTGAGASSAGTGGLVPAPSAGDNTKVLSGAGTWIAQPTVNNATLTIQQNGTSKGTFTANASSASTINIVADANVIESVKTNGTALTVTNKAVDIPNMTGAGASSAGTGGLVPAPSSGDNTKFLRGDATWAKPSQNVVTSDTGTGGYVVNSVAADTTDPSQLNVTRSYIKIPVAAGAPSTNTPTGFVEVWFQ